MLTLNSVEVMIRLFQNSGYTRLLYIKARQNHTLKLLRNNKICNVELYLQLLCGSAILRSLAGT